MVQVGQVVITRKRRADVLLAYFFLDETHRIHVTGIFTHMNGWFLW